MQLLPTIGEKPSHIHFRFSPRKWSRKKNQRNNQFSCISLILLIRSYQNWRCGPEEKEKLIQSMFAQFTIVNACHEIFVLKKPTSFHCSQIMESSKKDLHRYDEFFGTFSQIHYNLSERFQSAWNLKNKFHFPTRLQYFTGTLNVRKSNAINNVWLPADIDNLPVHAIQYGNFAELESLSVKQLIFTRQRNR